MKEPPALKPAFSTHEPNQNLSLYKGTVELEQNGRTLKAEGTIFFEWLPSPRLMLHIPQLAAGSDIDSVKIDRAKLRVPVVNSSINIYLSKVIKGWKDSQGFSSRISADICEDVYSGKGTSASYAIFHLVNFHAIFSEGISEGISSWAGRAVVDIDSWRLTIDNVKGFEALKESIKNERGYAITHVCKLEKLDASSFTVHEATDLLDALFWYFSFARGFFSPPILLVGFDETGDRVWERWPTAPRATPWKKGVESWFSDYQNTADTLGKSLAGFLHRWKDPLWNEVLPFTIHWFVSSNTNASAQEGSIILAQTGLELLSWVILVEDACKFPAREFENTRKFPAARKFGELLNHVGVSSSVPANLKRLSSLTRRMDWPNGPTAITKLRNAIVHPSRRSSTAQVTQLERYEVIQLSLWYIELTLLHLFYYHGEYANRLVGRVESVPWNRNP